MLLLNLTIVDKKLTAVCLFLQCCCSLVYKGVIQQAVINENTLFLALTLLLTHSEKIFKGHVRPLKTLLKHSQFTHSLNMLLPSVMS